LVSNKASAAAGLVDAGSKASTSSPKPKPLEDKTDVASRPVYVKDGRIYHHNVPGSTQMASFVTASAAIAAEKAGLGAILGLGAGGNVPGAPSLMAQVVARSNHQQQVHRLHQEQQQQPQPVCTALA
jgi:hypothetical protein